jgi:hypothetical protein
MSDVTFQEDQFSSKPTSTGTDFSQKKGIVGFLISRGVVKTEKQASMVCIVVIIVAVIISFTVWFMNSVGTNTLTPEEQRMTDWMSQGGAGAPPADFKPIR